MKKMHNLLCTDIIDHTSNIRVKIAHKISDFLLLISNVRGSTYFRKKITKFLIPYEEGLVISPTLHGIRLLVNVNDHIGKMIYCFGEYERNILRFLKKVIKKGDIFLDIGAYIGDISCIVSKFMDNEGIIYAIEPVPDHYKMLIKNIQLNRLKNILPFNFAIGDKNSIQDIYIKKKNNRGADTLVYSKNSKKSKLKTKVISIDHLIENGIIKVPKIIKIDVEGFELKVLKGASKLLKSSEAPILIIEYNTFVPQSTRKTNDIYHYISKINNYFIYKYNKRKRKLCQVLKLEDLPKFDNLYCFLDNHLYEFLNIFKKRDYKSFKNIVLGEETSYDDQEIF